MGLVPYNNGPCTCTIGLNIYKQIKCVPTTRIEDSIVSLRCQERRIARILSVQDVRNGIDV
jgi:hypothetical protein